MFFFRSALRKWIPRILFSLSIAICRRKAKRERVRTVRINYLQKKTRGGNKKVFLMTKTLSMFVSIILPFANTKCGAINSGEKRIKLISRVYGIGINFFCSAPLTVYIFLVQFQNAYCLFPAPFRVEL